MSKSYKNSIWGSADEAEFQEYLKKGFVDGGKEFMVERTIYFVLFFIFIILAVASLVLFYKYRNVYIIRQRNFGLTFTGGIFAFINVILGLLPQLFRTYCLVNVLQANVINTIVNLIFISRSFRVILFYRYNIFKVTSVKNKKLGSVREGFGNTIEPNYYIPRIYKKIKWIIILFITIPTLIGMLWIVIIYSIMESVREQCPINKLEDGLIKLKNNSGKELFYLVMAYSGLYMVFCILISIGLFYVKDVNKYGVKFECLTVSILIIISNILNIILQKGASEGSVFKSRKDMHLRFYLYFFDKTKGGKMLFTFVTAYMFFASITLPVIQFFRAKNKNKILLEDPMSSIQFFYKVLNTPALVHELRDIAIKEFSVENVLFWENYQILQFMVYRYQLEYIKAKEMGERLVSQYDFESFYQKQTQSYSLSSISNYTYDPNMAVPEEILPYYTSFYQMFIDSNGPAVVNLTNDISKRIFIEMCNLPTVGIFDEAKNEIVELMYSSIYPILLRKDKKYIVRTIS